MSKQTAKAIETRQLLLNTALRLFATKGFASTTMRAIAKESGLSLGSAYYYFESKDDIIHEFYRGLVEQQRTTTWPMLVEGNTLETNIRIALEQGLEILSPFHEFGPAFIRTAFSGAHGELGDVHRALEFGLWRQVVAMSRPLPPLAIRQDLPQLLWLIQRGIFLFWAYDSSNGAARSHRLVKNAAPMIARLVVLSRMPVVRTIIDDVLSLIRTAA